MLRYVAAMPLISLPFFAMPRFAIRHHASFRRFADFRQLIYYARCHYCHCLFIDTFTPCHFRFVYAIFAALRLHAAALFEMPRRY